MNIEVALTIDGTPVRANSGLNLLLQNAVDSYIKAQVAQQQVKNSKWGGPKKRITLEDKEKIIHLGTNLQHLTLPDATRQIMPIVGLGFSAIYRILNQATHSKTLNFKKSTFDKSEFKVKKQTDATI